MKRRDFLKASGVPLTYGILGPGFAAQVMGSKFFGDEAFQSEVLEATAAISRDRLPETLGWNFPQVINEADGTSLRGVSLPPQYAGQPIAVVGAGAAGLTAAYEMLKLGLDPVFFEMQQTVPADEANSYARPGGRGFTYDFTAGAFTPSVDPAVVELSKVIGDLGAMRYPTSHTALRAYVDKFIDAGQYQYADPNLGSTAGNEPSYANPLSGVWNLFRDPAIFALTGAQPDLQDLCVWPTDYHCRGVNNGNFYRLNRGDSLASADIAIQRLLLANYELLFGTGGVLTPLVGYYNDGDPAKIEAEWRILNEAYQNRTLYEVLIEAWPPDDPLYQVNGVSLVDLFGEIGIGSGGFDVFWGTTFMETLRIRIHDDEVSQRTFVGGTSYMLRPFLTNQGEGATQTLLQQSTNRVRTSPVVSIQRNPVAGIDVTTRQASSGSETTETFLGVVLTASPSVIRGRISIDESLFERGADDPAIVGLKNMTLTNSGKAFISFPGQPAGPPAFWMNRGAQGAPYWDNSNDLIGTLITDKNVRSAYTFDDYNFGSQINSTQQQTAGALMLSYTWGQNADSFTGLQGDQQAYIRAAWDQLKEIYGFGSTYDSDIEQALAAGNYQTISWTTVDGMSGGYRMSGPGMNAVAGSDGEERSQQHAMWRNCQGTKSGFCLAGEAVAWLGLSGWIEGAIQTGLASTWAILDWLNAATPAPVGAIGGGGHNTFALPAHPGPNVYVPVSATPVLFQDDFSGDLSQWDDDGLSVIEGGKLLVGGPKADPATLVARGEGWDDYEFTYSGNFAGRFDTLFRVRDTGNYYRLRILGTGTQRLHSVVDGVATLIASETPKVSVPMDGKDFTATIRVARDKIRVRIEGDGILLPELNADDSTHREGSIGFRTLRATQSLIVDDVVVSGTA